MGRPIHQKLILPHEAARKGKLTIHVPRGYEDQEPIGLCLVTGCGARFYKGQEEAWQRHVGPCARAHLAEERGLNPAVKNEGTMWDENVWDPEVAAHMKKLGERMLKEGRLTVKPSERAGF